MTAALTVDAVSSHGFAGLRDVWVAALPIFAVGLPLSYMVMVAVVLPYVLWLRYRDRLTWIPVYAGIAAIGAAIWSACWQMTLRPPSLPASLATGAAIGLAVGVVFCWVAGCGPGTSSRRTSLAGAADMER